MAFLARASGGLIKLDQYNLTWLPELIFAAVIGFACAYEYAWWIFIPATGISYISMQSGHATAYHMGRRPEAAQGSRKQTLSYIIDPICKFFGLRLGEGPYCYLFMGLKGFLIGIPLGPYAFLLAALWPISYDLGETKGYNLAEWISGASAGLCVAIFLGL